MNNNKREQERNELYRTIWTLANELRGSVDGWDFKQYVLGMLFYRYISENLTSYINKGEWDSGNNEFDYAKIDDDIAESGSSLSTIAHTPIDPILVIRTSPTCGVTLYFSKSSWDIYLSVAYKSFIFCTLTNFTPSSVY